MSVDYAAQLVYGYEIDTSVLDRVQEYMYETVYEKFAEKYPDIDTSFAIIAVGDRYGGHETWVLAHKDEVYEAGRWSTINPGVVIEPKFDTVLSWRLKEYAAALELTLKGEPRFFFAMGIS